MIYVKTFNKKRNCIKVDDLLKIKQQKLKQNGEILSSPKTPQLNNSEIQIRVESIQINNDEDRTFLIDHLSNNPGDLITIEINAHKLNSMTNKDTLLLYKYTQKQIQITNTNSNMNLLIQNSQFISIKLDLLSSLGFSSIQFNLIINNLKINCKKVYFLSYLIKNLLNFSQSSQCSQNDFTFQLKTTSKVNNSVKRAKSVNALIESFNQSNLIKFKIKQTKPKRSQTSPARVTQPPTMNAKTQIYYQFNSLKTNDSDCTKIKQLSHDSSKIITKTLFDFKCLFCQMSNIQSVSILVRHIINCHFRFTIKQSSHQNGTNCPKIDVCIDDAFDGSYLGNWHDLIKSAYLGYSKSRLSTTKRSSIDSTEVLVNKKSNFLNLKSLVESGDLTHDELEVLNLIQQQIVKLSSVDQSVQPKTSMMQRVYYHTNTTLPIHADELDHDSDSELDPDWLKEQTALLINDFADVNEGEKEMMRLWNLHCLHNNFIADFQIYSACEVFITEKVEMLSEKNLINNFELHLANLHDYGLLSRNNLIKLIGYLHDKLDLLKSSLIVNGRDRVYKKENLGKVSRKIYKI